MEGAADPPCAAGGQVEGFAFDLGGNLVYQTNYNGMVITNQYDELNRLTNQISVNGYQVGYVYDPATGQRVRMTDGSGVTAYGYDRRDRLVLKTVNWNQGPGVSLNYGYDANGSVTNLWSGTAAGVNVAYRYDPLNRLTNVVGQASRLAEYAYDAVGNLLTAGYGNGVTNQYQYDVLNRLTNLTASGVSGTIARFYYQLGLTGNRTNLSETVNGIGRTYAWKYDALNRLTNETISALGSVGYGYDAVGNRTNRASGISGLASCNSSYTANDWLTSDQYDANGNTTNSASVAYRYDVLNRLVDYNHGAVTLGYNGDGQRVVKNVGGQVTYYLVDDRNPSGYAQVEEEITAYAGTTNLTKVYAYGLDLISQEQPGVATNYYGHDGHGSVRYLTSTSGDITDTYTYDAYGNLVASSGSTANNYLYCGEQYDPQLKFYYNRARYLNPDTGRFWTMDTFAGNNEDPLSLHKYLYCQGNPVNKMDRTGLWPTHLGRWSSCLPHEDSINRVLGNVDLSSHFGGAMSNPEILQILRHQQLVIDTIHGSNEEAYMHAMRNGASIPQQSVADARTLANNFILIEIIGARDTSKPVHTRLEHLGNAMHTLQDSTSPPHHGFQSWPWPYIHPLSVRDHANAENFDPGYGSQLDAATLRVWNLFVGPTRQLLGDFFNGLEADKSPFELAQEQFLFHGGYQVQSGTTACDMGVLFF